MLLPLTTLLLAANSLPPLRLTVGDHVGSPGALLWFRHSNDELVELVAVRCSALQCVAVRRSALQCVAVRCSALQCVAVRASTKQYSAYRSHVRHPGGRCVQSMIKMWLMCVIQVYPRLSPRSRRGDQLYLTPRGNRLVLITIRTPLWWRCAGTAIPRR